MFFPYCVIFLLFMLRLPFMGKKKKFIFTVELEFWELSYCLYFSEHFEAVQYVHVLCVQGNGLKYSF